MGTGSSRERTTPRFLSQIQLSAFQLPERGEEARRVQLHGGSSNSSSDFSSDNSSDQSSLESDDSSQGSSRVTSETNSSSSSYDEVSRSLPQALGSLTPSQVSPPYSTGLKPRTFNPHPKNPVRTAWSHPSGPGERSVHSALAKGSPVIHVLIRSRSRSRVRTYPRRWSKHVLAQKAT